MAKPNGSADQKLCHIPTLIICLVVALLRDLQLNASLPDPSVHVKHFSCSGSKYNGENLIGLFLECLFKSDLKLFTLPAETISAGKLFHVSTILCENVFDSLPNKPWFLRICSTSLLKTLWEKEYCNFSCSYSVFHSFG